MHPHSNLIQSFYTNFQNLDVEGMKKCYHQDIYFSDSVFPALHGKNSGAMWAMLIENLKKNKDGWQLEFKNINCNETEGSCRWEAHYVFSATGRQVHNIIEANFQFKDGLIIRHADSFDFYRWARMAFGIKGTIIGWAPFFRRMVQSRVNGLLKRFMEKNQPGSFSRD